MAEKQENVPSNVFGGSNVAEQLKLTGKRISEARKALGISIREMAILHNITESEYLLHENGEADTSFSFLLKTKEFRRNSHRTSYLFPLTSYFTI